MQCPHCGGQVESSQARLGARLRAQGRCVCCGDPLSAAELARPKQPWYCRRCRLKKAEHARRYYLRVGRPAKVA